MSESFSKCAHFDVHEWIKFISDNPKSFKRGVSRYARTPLANVYDNELDPKHVVPVSHCVHACNMCDASFSTLQQFNLHVFKKHGVKNIMRLYINEHTHCSVCLKQFWSRPRLLNHIRYKSKVCKYNLILRGTLVSEEEATRQDVASASVRVALHKGGRRRHFAEDPVLQLQGPWLPIVPSPGMVISKPHRLGRGHNVIH